MTIENGGLETGDFTGWSISDWATIISTPDVPHSGNYCAQLPFNGEYMEQEIIGCIPQLNRYLKLWFRGSWSFSPAGGSILVIRVTYTDETYDEISRENTEDEADNWLQVNVGSYLSSEKQIKTLKLTCGSGFGGACLVDDVAIITGLFNNGGTIQDIDELIIRWFESQNWDVARRDVPMRTSGEVVDDDSYLVHAKTITITCRLSDAEKTSLDAIIDDGSISTFCTSDGVWDYLVWVGADSEYEYRVFDGTVRPWNTVIKMKVKSGGKV